MNKKLLSILACVAVAVTGGVSLVACGPVYTEVSSAEELVQLVSDKEAYIRLKDDITLSSTLDVNYKMSLDLNEHKISFAAPANEAAIRVDGRDVEIKNGTIDYTSPKVSSAIYLRNNASGVVDNITITSNSDGLLVSYGSQLTIQNSDVTAKWRSIGTNNLRGGENNTITVRNSNLKSTSDVSVFVSNYSKLDVEGSTIEGNYALEIMMGDINVRNSTLKATNPTHNPYTASTVQSSGTKETEGSTIVLRTNLYYDSALNTNDLKLNLTNNTYDSACGVQASIYNCNNKSGYLTGKDNVVNQYEIATNYFDGMVGEDFVVNTYVYDASTGTLTAGTLQAEAVA